MSVPYNPIDARGHRLTVGVRPLDLANWFEPDRFRISELTEKLNLEANLAQVYAELPYATQAVNELFDLVLENLATFHQDKFQVRNNSVWDIERQLEVSEPNQLLMLAQLLQDDFCIMSQTNEGWTLSAAVLFSPSRWALMDKIGKNLHGIHVPVPHYEDKLGRAVEQLFDRITVDKPVWRANWTILDDPTNFQPQPPSPAHRKKLEAAELLKELFFRVERQTLVRLPKSGAVVFTIRTYINSLEELLNTSPENKSLLLTALNTTDTEHIEYRGWQELHPRLTSLLENL